jgi:hypothetical protein
MSATRRACPIKTCPIPGLRTKVIEKPALVVSTRKKHTAVLSGDVTHESSLALHRHPTVVGAHLMTLALSENGIWSARYLTVRRSPNELDERVVRPLADILEPNPHRIRWKRSGPADEPRRGSCVSTAS